MFSLSKQSLHDNMERDHLSAGSSTMYWTTPQGWVLCRLNRDTTVFSACLWNPCTGDKHPLPDIIGEEHKHNVPYHNKCLLTHNDPAHPSCNIVLFNYEAPDFWYCHTTGAGGNNNTSTWRHCSYDIGNCSSIPQLPKGKKARRRRRRAVKAVIQIMASFQGKIYFSKSPTDMCTIDFSSCTSTTNHNHPKFRKLRVPMVDLPEGMCWGKHWLVESQDQLFAVTIAFAGFDPNNIGAVEVHRMDFSLPTQACWRRVHDIGDAVFLLEDANIAASCLASTLGLKPNQIFFMKNLLDDDGDLCSFDLETSTQEITQVHHRDDLIICRKPFWIVPPS